MMKGYMYILECADGSYYTGSTKDLEIRLAQHQAGEGANYTKKRLPVKLVYCEEFQRIDEAFYKEKQVQGWSRKKKKALIEDRQEDLPLLSRDYTQYPQDKVVSTGSTTATGSATATGSTTKKTSLASTSSATATSVPEPVGVVPEPVEG